jgi:beta-glucanase (GH16 family)
VFFVGRLFDVRENYYLLYSFKACLEIAQINSIMLMKTLILVALLSFAHSCLAQQDTLIWSDEFNGTGSPDAAKWSYDLGSSGWGNNEVQNYTSQTQNSRQENGALVIEALKSGNTWTSARILTNNKFEFTYGRIVFRAKLPVGIGTWPALWMLGENISTAGWPACGEIDVMEHVGKDAGVIHSSLHSSSSYGNTTNTGTKYINTFNTEFHLYEAKWKSDRIEFSIDSILFYTYKPSVYNNSTWPFNKPFFFIMNIAMGGNWGSDPQYETGGLKNGIDPALSSARMEIDYVRVYESLSHPYIIEDPSDKNYQADVDGIILFPNPSRGIVQINFPAGENARGTVSDIFGNEVFLFQADNDSTEIDLSKLAKGPYFIILQTEEKIITKKIVLK